MDYSNTTLVKVKWLNTDNNYKTCLNSNTTLVKVKCAYYSYLKSFYFDSNTTLVKVKSSVMRNAILGATFKYNTC